MKFFQIWTNHFKIFNHSIFSAINKEHYLHANTKELLKKTFFKADNKNCMVILDREDYLNEASNFLENEDFETERINFTAN